MTATDEVQPAVADDEQIVDPDQHAPQSFGDSIRKLSDRRLLVIFFLGICQGYPWLLTTSAMSAWLQETGLSRSSIGAFGLITVVYAFNAAWSPLVDRVSIPFLSRLGHRKGWILAMQLLMTVATVGIALNDPAENLELIAVLALGIAICSATQDVAIDAYRVEAIPRHETGVISLGSGMITAGWWTGYGFLGFLPFYVADLPGWGWNRVYLVLTAVWVAIMAGVFLVPRIVQRRDKFAAAEARYEQVLGQRSARSSRLGQLFSKALAWLIVTIWEPLREFFVRSGFKIAIFLLLFVFSFKLGEAFLGRMSIVFYKEIGFTNEQIGIMSKAGTALVTIVFSIVGSIVNARFGLIKGLFLGGLAMAGSNLMFSWIALVGPDMHLYFAAILVDGFTAAFSTVAFVAFISYFTSHTYTATQYALLASLGNLGRTTVASASGFVVDALGGNWNLFFILTALMVLPSLAILLYLGKLLKERVPDWEGGRA